MPKPPNQASFSTFVLVWLAFLGLPFALATIHPSLGPVAGLVLPCIWFFTMPTTCFKGGFMAFPMAVIQLGMAALWLSQAWQMLIG